MKAAGHAVQRKHNIGLIINCERYVVGPCTRLEANKFKRTGEEILEVEIVEAVVAVVAGVNSIADFFADFKAVAIAILFASGDAV